MDQSDPNIIMAAGNINDPNAMLALKMNMQKLQQAEQQSRGQNALRQLFAAPGAIDPTTNLPTAKTIAQAYQIDPKSALDMADNAASMQASQQAARDKKLARQKELNEGVDPYRVEAMTAYNTALKGPGGNEEVARKAAQDVWDKGLTTFEQGADLSSDERSQLDQGRSFDPVRIANNSPTWQKNLKEAHAEKVADEARSLQERGIAEREHHDEVVEGLAGQKAAVASAPSDMTEEDKDYWADVVRKGGTLPPGLSRTAAGSRLVQDLMKRVPKGSTASDLIASQAEVGGLRAGERTLATRQVNMENAANEVKTMAPLALQASEKVNRTQFPTLNSIILATEKGTGDENVVRFGLAANSLIYMYAKFLNPNGIPTDADKAKATDILSTAWAKGQFRTAVDQIQQEIKAGQSGVKTTREELREGETGKPSNGAPKTFKYDAQGNPVQ